MAGDFDIRKLSQAFLNRVDEAMKEGKSGIADKKEDFMSLSNILAGLDDSKTNEKAYVQSKINEYITKYKLNDLRSRASEWARNAVDSLKGLFKPKKEFNIDEANYLLKDLETAEQEGRTEDVEYIREELHNAGFDDLLKEYDQKCIKLESSTPLMTNAEKTDNILQENTKKSEKTTVDKNIDKEGKMISQTPKSKSSKSKGAQKTNNNVMYTPAQEKVLEDMRVRTNAILKTRDNQNARVILIQTAETILKDAKALNLEDTDEYKTLDKLCKENAEIVKAHESQKIQQEKAKKQEISDKLYILSTMSNRELKKHLEEAKKLLKEAESLSMQNDLWYKNLKYKIDKITISN